MLGEKHNGRSFLSLLQKMSGRGKSAKQKTALSAALSIGQKKDTLKSWLKMRAEMSLKRFNWKKTKKAKRKAFVPNINPPESLKEMPLAVIRNMAGLATSGFGVVVALAWNEAIKSAVETYISPLLGERSGVISLFIYAVVVTLLAVVATMQLSRVQKGLEEIESLKEALSKKKSQK